MKRVTGLLLGATVLTFGSVVSFAQQPQGEVVVRHRIMQGPDAPPPPPGDIIFVASEMSFGGKVVKGAPYSAQAVTESIQTLGDGNRIVNRNSSAVYRDGEGRTRREINLKGLGNLGTGGEPFQSVFIHDPVAGVTYALDSKSHVAHKSAPFKIEWSAKDGGEPVGVTGQRFEMRVRTGDAPEAGVVATGSVAGPVQIAPPIGVQEAGQMTFKTENGGSSYIFKRSGPNPNEVKQELGKQLVEGVEAVGTRTTVTIPAGEIGNERAIEIVSERWYSEELQTVIMTRHSDPRNGETIYKLTNINRSEPAKLLFEVPAGYTVKEGPAAPPPAPGIRVKKLATPE
jgi:hypothetical protein